MNKLNEVMRFLNKQIKVQASSYKTNKRLKKYYIESKQDTRSNIAKTLDYMGLRIFIFFLTIFFAQIKFDNIYLSVATAIFLTCLIHLTAIFLRNNRHKKIVFNRRKYFASQMVYEAILAKGISEFERYMCLILEKSGLCIKKHTYLSDRDLLIDACYKDINLTIMCKKDNNDIAVPLKEIKEFYQLLKNEHLHKGIIISNTDFTKECQNFIEENFLKDKITLINKEKFLKIIDKAGLFPTIEEIDEYLVDTIEKQEKKIIAYKEVFLAKEKVKSYIILSLLLLILPKYTMFQRYYVLTAVFLMVLATITIYSNIKRKNHGVREFNFDELLSKNKL